LVWCYLCLIADAQSVEFEEVVGWELGTVVENRPSVPGALRNVEIMQDYMYSISDTQHIQTNQVQSGEACL